MYGYGGYPFALLGQRIRYQSSLRCVLGPDVCPATVSVVFPLWGATPHSSYVPLCLLQHPVGSEKTSFMRSQK